MNYKEMWKYKHSRTIKPYHSLYCEKHPEIVYINKVYGKTFKRYCVLCEKIRNASKWAKYKKEVV